MLKSKSISKNYIYNLTYQIFAIFVPLVTTPYVSRILGAELIGMYSYTASIASYFALFAALGLNMYGQREIAYAGNNKEKRSLIFWRIFKIKLLSVSLAILVYGIFVIIYKSYTSLLLIQSISILSVFFDVTWFYQGEENFKIVAVRNIIVKIICTVSIFLLIKSENDLNKYVLINVLSVLISNIILYLGIPSKIYRINLKDVSLTLKDIKIVMELFVPLIATQVYNVLDKTMLGVIVGNTLENGYYEQAQKIINIGLAVITSLGPVLYPSVSRFYAENQIDKIKDVVRKSYKIVFMISCPIAFGIMGVASNFVPLFFGEGFEPVISLLYIYSIIILIIPFSNIAGYAILTPTLQQNKGTLAVIVGAIINFSLNSILIPRHYAVGAAIATVVAELIVSAIHIYFIRSYIDVKRILIDWLTIAIGAGAMFVCVKKIGECLSDLYMSSLLILIIQILTGIIVYGIFLVVFKRRDLEFLIKIKDEK